MSADPAGPPPVLWRALQTASVPALCQLLGIDTGTMYRWVRHDGPIPACKVAWLGRWNRSPERLQRALLAWITL